MLYIINCKIDIKAGYYTQGFFHLPLVIKYTTEPMELRDDALFGRIHFEY